MKRYVKYSIEGDARFDGHSSRNIGTPSAISHT